LGCGVQESHDRLYPRATFGELGADGVPKPMGADRRLPSSIDQAGGGAGCLERLVEQE
jgi:hypothetical protein